MITIEREKTVVIPFMGTDVVFRFNVPTAEETSTKLKGSEVSDVFITETFGIKFQSRDISGWENGIKPREAIDSPGTFNLISKAAYEVVKSAFLLEDEKN